MGKIKETPGWASVVEEEFLRVEEGPNEIFVGLAGGENWVGWYGLVTFLGRGGSRLVLFSLQISKRSGEFFWLGWAGKSVEIELGEKILGLCVFLFCEICRP